MFKFLAYHPPKSIKVAGDGAIELIQFDDKPRFDLGCRMPVHHLHEHGDGGDGDDGVGD